MILPQDIFRGLGRRLRSASSNYGTDCHILTEDPHQHKRCYILQQTDFKMCSHMRAVSGVSDEYFALPLIGYALEKV